MPETNTKKKSLLLPSAPGAGPKVHVLLISNETPK